jgi:polyisoprenoid-binding protein YceI|tara:strand:- start:40 stop:546 length:507 start_codon:yes stop_codon:yes gene_type:complete
MVALYLIFFLFGIQEENRYVIESSSIEFYSYAPLEDIEAVNTESVGAIDLSTGEFIIKIPVSSFEFPNKLMQKHFNDSYLETDRYPECVFRGKLDGDNASGEITLHGVTKKISVPVIMNKSEEIVTIDTEFKIALKDHKIKVPRLLFQNIAEEIEVKVTSSFKKYQSE